MREQGIDDHLALSNHLQEMSHVALHGPPDVSARVISASILVGRIVDAWARRVGHDQFQFFLVKRSARDLKSHHPWHHDPGARRRQLCGEINRIVRRRAGEDVNDVRTDTPGHRRETVGHRRVRRRRAVECSQ